MYKKQGAFYEAQKLIKYIKNNWIWTWSISHKKIKLSEVTFWSCKLKQSSKCWDRPMFDEHSRVWACEQVTPEGSIKLYSLWWRSPFNVKQKISDEGVAWGSLHKAFQDWGTNSPS